MNVLLTIAAVVAFAVAAILLLAVDAVDTSTSLGLIAVGLACWAAAALVGATGWTIRR